ncbi:MAG: MFS transporter [Chloroflexi bacterium]|nr:MFS transporter [Chloroflexota bacterium]
MRNGARQAFRRFEPGIWVLTAIGFLNVAGFSISVPFLSLYLYQERGLSMTMVGTIMLISGLSSAVTQGFSGALADRFGRRPLLLGTLLVSGLVYASIAVLISAATPIVIIVIVYTVGRSVVMMMRPAITSIVVDLAPKARLTEAFGLLRVGQNLGWAAGPAIGGYLLGLYPYAWLFGFAGFTSAAAFITVFFLMPESLGKGTEKADLRGLLSPAKDRSFLTLTVFNLLLFIVMGQMVSTLSVFAVDRAGLSTAQYGFLLTLNGIIVVLFQYPMSRAVSRMSRATALMLGSIFYGIGYLFMTWAGAYALAIMGMIIITVGEIIFSPVTLAAVGDLAPVKQRGHYMGLYGLSETLGISLGPMLGGVLLDAFPTNALPIWGVITLLAFAAAIGFGFWGGRPFLKGGQSQ